MSPRRVAAGDREPLFFLFFSFVVVVVVVKP